MSRPQDPSLADAALAYANAGLPVLPLEPGGKAPHRMLEGPPLCPGGVNHATTNAERIAYWWREDPDANIGVACGVNSNWCVVVLDLDDWTALARLDGSQRHDLVAAAKVASARGGHFYFATDEPVKGGRIVPGLSLHGAGTYVVAPPSRHPSGTVYEWLTNGTPWRRLPALPDWARPRRQLEPLPAARRVPLSDESYLIGDRALGEARARLLARPRGERTNRRGALYAAARTLGEYVGAGLLDPECAASELANVADRLGVDSADAQRHIQRGIAHGMGIAA